MTLDRMRVAEITGILAHVSGILDALPLAAYADAIQADASSVASEHTNGSLETPAGAFRRARRTELVSAAGHAEEFVQAMQSAVAHYRAARRAEALEQSIEEERQRGAEATVRAFNEPHAAAIRRAYPGATVITMPRREEALTDDDPA